MDKKHTLAFYSKPFAVREKGNQAGTSGDTYARYQVWDFRFDWPYDFDLYEPLITQLGALTFVRQAESELYRNPGDWESLYKQRELLLYPMLNAKLGYQFTHALDLTFDGRYGYNGKGRVGDASLSLNYKFTVGYWAGL